MPDHLTTVATFLDPVAAALARNYLDSQGIPAMLIDETTIATDWMLGGAIGGIKLQVWPLDLERAEHLLTQLRARRDADAAVDAPEHAVAASPETAEELQAQREDRAEINQLVDRLFRATVFGLIVWPLQLYALYLLFGLSCSEGSVAPRRRWKIWASVLLSVPIMGSILMLVSCGLGFLLR